MSVAGSRVAVAGGSIAGCAAAIALKRAGCDVRVYERSSSALMDRGAGIAIPGPLRETLVSAGYLPEDYAHCSYAGRQWIVADGSWDGRVLWTQPSPINTKNWSMLWAALRAGVDNDCYVDGRSITGYRHDGGAIAVTFDDGHEDRVDLLVGADGYRSVIRSQMQPATHRDYAGYVLWRGNFSESRIPHDNPLRSAFAEKMWQTIVFPGGHCIMYMIPDHDDRVDAHHRRLNWAVYTPTPAGLDFEQPQSIPPGGVDATLYDSLDRLLSSHFPPAFADLVRLSGMEEVSIQAIYDEVVESYADGRVMLIGDAGCITRPHTGSGATKALQDALILEKLACDLSDWSQVLAGYDAERTEAGTMLMQLGRRLGHAQVERTPNWTKMRPSDFVDWTRASLAGEQLYLYGEESDRQPG